MKKVLFLGSKKVGYHCLQYLLDHRNELGIDIIGVLTNPEPKIDHSFSVEQLAAEHGLPVLFELEELGESQRCDLLISVQYHRILKPAHIALAELAVNLHMAPLPEYRGCNQFSFAIIDQAKEFGTTLHILEEGIDSGAIIAENRFPVAEDISVSELHKITTEKSIELFRDSIASIVRGTFRIIPQEELVPQRGTSLHYRKEIDGIKQLDVNWPPSKLKRYIRATSMPGFEPPYFTQDGEIHHLILDENDRVVIAEDPNLPIKQNAGIRNVTFGKGVRVVEPANLYGCEIGDYSFVGPFCEIQAGAVIGKHTRVQSHAFICELVQIGDHCFISHGAMFINDTFSNGGPAGGDRSRWKGTRIGSHVSIGTNATILPVSICDHVVVGAGAVVTKDINEPGIYAGNPARKIRS